MRTQDTTSLQTGTLPSTHQHTYSDKLFFHHLNSLVPSVQPVKGIYLFNIIAMNEVFHFITILRVLGELFSELVFFFLWKRVDIYSLGKMKTKSILPPWKFCLFWLIPLEKMLEDFLFFSFWKTPPGNFNLVFVETLENLYVLVPLYGLKNFHIFIEKERSIWVEILNEINISFFYTFASIF